MHCTFSILAQSFLCAHAKTSNYQKSPSESIFLIVCPGELWQLHAWIGEGERPTEQEGALRAVNA